MAIIIVGLHGLSTEHMHSPGKEEPGYPMMGLCFVWSEFPHVHYMFFFRWRLYQTITTDRQRLSETWCIEMSLFCRPGLKYGAHSPRKDFQPAMTTTLYKTDRAILNQGITLWVCVLSSPSFRACTMHGFRWRLKLITAPLRTVVRVHPWPALAEGVTG